MVVNFSLDDISTAARHVLGLTGRSNVFAFHGDMGAGKTTLIEAVGRELGVMDTMGSPTFSIINEYRTRDGRTVYHMDLYRLKDEQEARSAGVEDCLYSGDLCLVEWPEKAPALLPADTIHCYIGLTANNERKLEINA
ncbi:MAG: tRNA (adenosine(37)-N6)-threonylcarbamoyltransferase complex ATPase subunit type 1 TsaE [Ferruginibacter sp.]|jgi:tRNA threonylcarbamoyladenosine biosynthesis protein TsaE